MHDDDINKWARVTIHPHLPMSCFWVLKLCEGVFYKILRVLLSVFHRPLNLCIKKNNNNKVFTLKCCRSQCCVEDSDGSLLQIPRNCPRSCTGDKAPNKMPTLRCSGAFRLIRGLLTLHSRCQIWSTQKKQKKQNVMIRQSDSPSLTVAIKFKRSTPNR